MPNPFETPSSGGTPETANTTPARQPRAKMSPETTLGTALLIYAGTNFLAGLLMFTFPKALWVSIGGASATDAAQAYTSTRFAGAMMITLALAAILVIRKPARQNTLVTVLCVGQTLVAAANFANAIADHPPTYLLFEWVVAIGSGAVALFMWWARILGRKALKEG